MIEERKIKKNTLYRFLRPFFVFCFKIIFNPRVIGSYNIPKTGSVILVSNHFNSLDFISMGITTKRSIYFLAKDSLFKGILKHILLYSGVIPVNRRIKDRSVISASKKVLGNNSILGIFPEGTFNKTNNILAKFKIVAVKLSYEEKTPIIPIAIVGQYKRNKLKIIVGKKIYIKSNNYDLENKKLMNILEKLIIENKGV